VFKPVSKNPRAFGIIVEGNLLDNFGIQSLGYFFFKRWKKSSERWLSGTIFATRRTRA
jgi:hypothetical protein